MDWLRQEDNPYFARALVNRVWASHFGRGIVEPPDDMNLANPPVNGPLLDYLTRQFVAHGYDLRWLHGEILSSHAYQRSWRSPQPGIIDERNFSRAILRRLPAEVVYDALVISTASDSEMKSLASDEAKISQRAIGPKSGFSNRRDETLYAVYLFGKPAREINCDCERSASPSLQQTLFLRNDSELLALLDRKEGWLAQIDRESGQSDRPPAEELMAAAYLRTLSRMPTADERTVARAHFAAAESPRDGLRDLLWALLNTKEFVVNH
jgi:uncharacterized protein DUF1553